MVVHLADPSSDILWQHILVLTNPFVQPVHDTGFTSTDISLPPFLACPLSLYSCRRTASAILVGLLATERHLFFSSLLLQWLARLGFVVGAELTS